MKIHFSPYEINPLAPLNNFSLGQKRLGALLRVEFEKDLVGYGDVHPWTELGDAPLAEQLGGLYKGELTDLTRKSIGFAGMDAKARKEGVGLLSGVEIPESHVLVLEPNFLKPEHITALSQRGYRFAKLKMGVNLQEEVSHLNKLASLDWNLKNNQTFLLRLDFNTKPSFEEFEKKFLSKINDKLKSRIDFIEDPCPYNPKHWQEILDQGFTLTYDRKDQGLPISGLVADIIVYKPAVEEGTEILEYCKLHEKKMFVTSYMDHSVGQMFAAVEAARYQQEEPQLFYGAGLLSHLVYEKEEFCEQFKMQGPRFVPPSGVGIGFDELLKKRSWLEMSQS